MKITHPDRIIDTSSGTRKLQLAQFYQSISEWLLPFLRDRPVSLLRAPEGIDGEQFFQKHSERLAIPHIKQLDQRLDPEHACLMQIDIFIDYLRNARGASTVAAYSVRARPGLPVSVPISREALKGLRGAQQWTVANLQQRLQGLKENPWAGYANRQTLSKKMWDTLGATPPQ